MTTVVYGGTGGIGMAVVRRVIARGGSVHLVARDAERLRTLAAESGATFTAADVLDTQIFERVNSEVAGPIEGLVYAIGSIELKPLTRLTCDDFLRDFQLNAAGAALAVKAHLAGLKKCGSACKKNPVMGVIGV